MPYDTPYNRFIASIDDQANRRYARYNAYSNLAYNSNAPFSMVYKELELPAHHYQMMPTTAHHSVSNMSGGITMRNMEGSAGVLGDRFRPSVLHEDIGRPMLSRPDAMRESYMRQVGRGYTGGEKCDSCSSGSDDDEMDGGKGCDDEMDGGARCCFNSAMCNGQPRFKRGERAKKANKPAKETDRRYKRNRTETGAGYTGGMGIAGDELYKHNPPYMLPTGEYHTGASLGAGMEEQALSQAVSKEAKSGGRKPSQWIMYVKKWASDHKMSYRDALRSPQLKSDYAGAKKGGFAFLAPLAISLATKGAKALAKYAVNKYLKPKESAPAPAPAPVVDRQADSQKYNEMKMAVAKQRKGSARPPAQIVYDTSADGNPIYDTPLAKDEPTYGKVKKPYSDLPALEELSLEEQKKLPKPRPPVPTDAPPKLPKKDELPPPRPPPMRPSSEKKPSNIVEEGFGKRKPTKAFMKALCKQTGRSESEMMGSPQLKQAHEMYMESLKEHKKSGGKMPSGSAIAKWVAKAVALIPFNAIKLGVQNIMSKKSDDVNPLVGKTDSAGRMVSGLFSGKKKGGSILGGPANDPVNGSKISGGAVKGILTPKYMKPIGVKYEGATLGAGRKGKTGSALYKTPAVVPLDVKAGVPPSEDQVSELEKITEVAGNGRRKKGGMLKSQMIGSTISGFGKRKPSAWVQHCMAFAKAKGIKYGDALKSAECKASYKK